MAYPLINYDTAFDEFLITESRGKLTYLIGELERQPDGKQSLWIPDGLEGIRPNGSHFPAEATLSRYELSTALTKYVAFAYPHS